MDDSVIPTTVITGAIEENQSVKSCKSDSIPSSPDRSEELQKRLEKHIQKSMQKGSLNKWPLKSNDSRKVAAILPLQRVPIPFKGNQGSESKPLVDWDSNGSDDEDDVVFLQPGSASGKQTVSLDTFSVQDFSISDTESGDEGLNLNIPKPKPQCSFCGFETSCIIS